MSQRYPLPSFWGTSEYKEQTKQLIALLDPGPIRDSCFAKSLITASQRNKLQSISFGEEHNRRLLAILENGTNDSFKTFLAILIDQDIAYYGDLLPVLKAVAASGTTFLMQHSPCNVTIKITYRNVRCIGPPCGKRPSPFWVQSSAKTCLTSHCWNERISCAAFSLLYISEGRQ